MLFYLTNAFLDVVWGSAFWVLRKTTSGAYYLVYGDGTATIDDKEYETIILTKENIENDEQLKQLLQKTEKQEEQIKELTENIKELTKLIKGKDK